MKDIVDVNAALLELNQLDLDSYFLDIMHTNSFDVGVLRLNPGQKDTQVPHSTDELYFVVEGEGFISIQGNDHKIRKGSCIFIPSKIKHYFHGNKERLIVLYVFRKS
ncbi:MAG: cupin domain-containing protein [Candidatus Nitrosocosmicus sp.]